MFCVLGAVVATTSHIARRDEIPAIWLWAMLGIHLVATLFYMSTLEGDWESYLSRGLQKAATNSSFDYIAPNNNFIYAICHFIQLDGKASTAAVFFSFSLCGFLGHVFFLAACRPFIKFEFDRYWLLLFLLPGLHVWTCAIGKDSLIFMSLCYALYATSRNKLANPLLAGSWLLTYMIRPHIAFCLIVAWLMGSVFSRNDESTTQKAGKVAISFLALFLALPGTQAFLGVEEISVEGTLERLDVMATYNQTGGGAVGLDQLNPPARLLTFMFRPFFFDVKNDLGWLASLENLLLLSLFAYSIYNGILKWLIGRPDFATLFAFFFTIGLWFLLGMSLANLGLVLRQKTMLLPFLFYVFFSFRYWKQQQQLAHAYSETADSWQYSP